MKVCSTCKQDKPHGAYHRSRTCADGMDPRCKACRKAARVTHVTDGELKRSGHRLRQYGITAEQYQAMYAEQQGLCAICRQGERMTYLGSPKQLCVDHDHETGKVRGLLCSACNWALGKFEDDPARLRAAAEYLETHAATRS